MINHVDIPAEGVRAQIRSGFLRFAGNAPGKIYGQLNCTSGGRMKRENRVFFESEEDARHHGYRPCGNCMPEAYRQWKGQS